METKLIKEARLIAFMLHNDNMYGKMPYCFHLMDVVRNLLDYGYDNEEMIMAGYLHDVIEDTDVTREKLEILCGEKVAKLVWAVSGEGANRKEKKANMIKKLMDYPKAIPLKMADRLANIQNCVKNNPRLLEMYKSEMGDYTELFVGENLTMFLEMCRLCNLNLTISEGRKF